MPNLHTNERSTTTPLFPLFADLRGRVAVVVGGGVVARRKVEALLEAGAEASVVAQTLEPTLAEWAAQGRVAQHAEPFRPEHLDGAWLAIAAADATVNRAVAAAGAARGIFVNVVDDAAASSFHVPARVRRGALQVAISTAGAAPVLARRMRERLEAELDESLGALAQLLARQRARIRWRFPEIARRRRFLESLLDGDLPRLLRDGDAAAAGAVFDHALQTDDAGARTGHVSLVGAGPGDPGLLTLKALRALQDADVIVHDRLVGAGILELARRDAERIDVGKRVGENHDATQARIHSVLRAHARAGRRVVRLKGGDPGVFGRAGEEIDFLRAHGIAFSIIPGISAAFAAAAAVGISLTDRRHARSLTLVSPRGASALDDAALALPGQTLAVYMGVAELDAFAIALQARGRAAATPCAIIEHASLPQQRVLRATLGELAALAHRHTVQAPALLIIGEVAAEVSCAHAGERCRCTPAHPASRAA